MIFVSNGLTSSFIGALTGLYTGYGIIHHINYVSSSSREVDPFIWPLTTLDTTSSKMVLFWLIMVQLVWNCGESCLLQIYRN